MNPYATGDPTSLLVFPLAAIAIGLIVLMVCVGIVIALGSFLKKGLPAGSKSKRSDARFDKGKIEKEGPSTEE